LLFGFTEFEQGCMGLHTRPVYSSTAATKRNPIWSCGGAKVNLRGLVGFLPSYSRESTLQKLAGRRR